VRANESGKSVVMGIADRDVVESTNTMAMPVKRITQIISKRGHHE
jgi:hypothetical protein